MSTRRDKYIAGAVAAEIARVENAAKGARNATLFIAAQALGQLVAAGALTDDHVHQALTHAAAANGCPTPQNRTAA